MQRLERIEVSLHPAVLGEIALGTIARRAAVRHDLGLLPRPVVATDDEVLGLIARYDLAGSGIGWVDAHLVAAARLTPGTSIWTRDRRLRDAAKRSRVGADLA